MIFQFAVTGAAGFIGSHVVELLIQQGYQVLALDNLSSGDISSLENVKNHKKFSFREIDIRNTDTVSIALKGISHVIHLAGLGEIVPSIRNPQEYISTNVLGTSSLLKAAGNCGVKRVVYAASSSCYGDTPKIPTNENDLINIKHPYALSKYLGELTAFSLGQTFGVEVNSIRIFNAYGRRVRTSGTYGAVLGVFLKQLLSKKPLTIVGDGKQSRDFVHVTDVAIAFVKASVSHKSNKIWNLGSGKPVSILNLAKLLGGELVHIPDRPGEPRVTHADISCISKDLDWYPTIEFEKGIGEILLHLKEWENAPLWDQVSIARATEEWFEAFADRNRD